MNVANAILLNCLRFLVNYGFAIRAHAIVLSTWNVM